MRPREALLFIPLIFSACGIGSDSDTPTTQSPGDPIEPGIPLVVPNAEDVIGGYLLSESEPVQLGRLIITNNSKLLDISIVPQNLPLEIAQRIGLTNLEGWQLYLEFTDDPDPSTPEVETTFTGFNPESRDHRSFVSIPPVIDLTNEQRNLPNSSLDSPEIYSNYISVLMSQQTVVELYNQAQLEQVSANATNADFEAIDNAANQLGVDYVNLVLAGLAEPFIMVIFVNQD